MLVDAFMHVSLIDGHMVTSANCNVYCTFGLTFWLAIMYMVHTWLTSQVSYLVSLPSYR